MHPDSTYCTS